MLKYLKPATVAGVVAALALGLVLTRPRQVIHAEGGCDASILTGSYTVHRKGEVYDSRGNLYFLSQIGVLTFDAAGSLTGSDTFSADGGILRRTLTGSYSVTPECTGTLTLKGSDNTEDHADMVIAREGKEVDWIQTDPNFVFSGTMKRQAP